MLKSLYSIGYTPNTTEAEKESHQFLVLMGCLMSMGGLLWGSICMYFELYLPASIPYGYVIFTILNFVLFRFGKSFKWAKFIQVSISLFLPFAFQWGLGGFVSSGAIMFWSMLALTGAMTFENLKASGWWLATYLALVIFSSLADGYFRQYSLNLPANANTLFFALNVGIVSSVVFGLFIFFKYQLEKSVENEKEKQRALEAREIELQEAHQEVLASEEELRQNAEELKTTNENLVKREIEIQATNQELLASEEELKQNAEELRAINEHLESIKIDLEDHIRTEADAKEKLEKAHKELQDTQGQLLQAEKLSSLGQMTAGIAHEINNPLNFVSAGSQSLQMLFKDLTQYLHKCRSLKNASAEEIPQMLAEVKAIEDELVLDELMEDIFGLMNDVSHGADRASEIVKGLKNFSRTDGGKYKQANLYEGLDSTLMLLRNRMESIELVTNYDENISEIECYSGELNQVFMNLMGNAIDAMNEKGTLTVSTYNLGDNIRIEIQDTGAGMPQATIDKIFEPFFTTKPVGKGTGLGLSISFGIIEKHEGEIKVESREGEGTKFILLLPKSKNHTTQLH